MREVTVLYKAFNCFFNSKLIETGNFYVFDFYRKKKLKSIFDKYSLKIKIHFGNCH